MSLKLCELCNKRSAKYVCQECGRVICERCIDSYSWLCLECYEKFRRVSPLETEELERTQIPFMKMFLLGFILMFIGVIILVLATLLFGLKESFSLIFLIGPIPIILGAGENIILPLIFAAVLITIYIIVIVLLAKKR